MGKYIGFIRYLSIYKRLIISFLIIVCIPNLLIGYYSFNISSHELEDKISNSSSQTLINVESVIDEKLNLYEDLSNQIFNNDRIKELLKKCNEYNAPNNQRKISAEEYKKSKEEIGSILYQISPSKDISNMEIVTDYDQFTQVNYYGESRGASIANIAAFIKSQNYKAAIQEEGLPIWINTAKEYGIYKYQPYNLTYIGNYITLLRSITDGVEKRSLGVIIINIPTNIFNNIADFKTLYDNKEVVFLSGTGGIVSILNRNYNTTLPDKDILSEIAKKSDGAIIRNISNKDSLLTYHNMSKIDMTIVYMAERDKILSSVYKVRNIIIELTIVCIICALVLSYFITSSIAGPMSKLKNAMKNVGQNGLKIEYKDPYKDEIGVLGENFNIMMSRIENLLGDLIQTEVSRKNEEIRRKTAELDTLQMQINPHFIYNTLDIIRWNTLFLENGEGKVSKMISDFSALLRFNTIKTNKLVEINEEIEHTYIYLKVLNFKADFKLNISIDISDSSILQSKITKLTFQPIVENAVKHGLINAEGTGTIKISAYTSEEDLFVEIRDNGIGIPEEQLNILNSGLKNGELPHKSIGLRNVNERIKLQFGEKYGLSMSSKEGEYTSVIIYIPRIA